MSLQRDDDGKWSLVIDEGGGAEVPQKSHASYMEAVPRYLTLFDRIFTRAKARWEFWFLWTLLDVRGARDAGWSPYETSVEAIDEMIAVHERVGSYRAARHLQLWIYGHIVEASEPYEILANLIDISQGGQFNISRFSPNSSGAPRSPGLKITLLERAAKSAGLEECIQPLREIWDRDLRNAIFHSDYSLHGGEVRFTRNTRPFPSGAAYDREQTLTLVNRALAYFEAIRVLRAYNLGSYTEPKEILADPRAMHDERAVVMVREGHGVIGLKHGFAADELKAGKIPWCVGVFTQAEWNMTQADQTRAHFPPTAI